MPVWTPDGYKLQKGTRDDPAPLPQVEMIIGLLSVPAARAIRLRRRSSWLTKSRYDCAAGLFDYRFVLSIRESFDGRLLAEARDHEDMLFVDAPAGFDMISHKVKLFVDWAVDNFQFRYLLKADDDSTICLSSLCAELGRAPPGQPLYMGKMKYNNSVKLNPQVRQYNPRYLRETGNATYHPYAGGAGYAVSTDVAQQLAARTITESSALPFRHFPREDATFGLWMSGFVRLVPRESNRRWLLAHPLPSRASNNRAARYRPKLAEDEHTNDRLPRHCLHVRCGQCSGAGAPTRVPSGSHDGNGSAAQEALAASRRAGGKQRGGVPAPEAARAPPRLGGAAGAPVASARRAGLSSASSAHGADVRQRHSVAAVQSGGKRRGNGRAPSRRSVSAAGNAPPPR